MRHCINYLCLFFFGLVSATLIFEIYLRVTEATILRDIFPVAEVSLYGPDPQTGYTHRANISGIWATENRARISTNLYGFRANGLKDETIGQDKDWLRIGIIGNSVVEALQVNDTETFIARAEKDLQNAGYKIRIYNLGLAGSPPALEIRRAYKFSKLLNLDFIFFFNSPDNITHNLDYSQGGTSPFYRLEDKGNVVIDESFLKTRSYQIRQSFLGEFFYGLMQHLKIMNVLNHRLNHGIFAELNGFLDKNHGNQASKKTSACETQALEMLAGLNQKKSINDRLKLFNAYIDDLKKIETETQAQVIFSLYDTWEDCDLLLREKSYGAFSKRLSHEKIEFFHLQNALRKAFPDQENINLSNLRGFGASQGYGHLNDLGHTVFSEALKNYILENIKIKE